MVLFTSIALKLAPNDIVEQTIDFANKNQNIDIHYRSTPNLVKLAVGILLDTAWISTLISTSIICPQMQDFWSHAFVDYSEISYTVALLTACIIVYACAKMPSLYKELDPKAKTNWDLTGDKWLEMIDAKEKFINSRDKARFLCFPSRSILPQYEQL